jgi:hypothetical protein
MPDRFKRRIASTAYRLLTSIDEAQYRAMDRLESLAGFDIMLEIWLATKPDPTIVNAIINARLIGLSPMRNVLHKHKLQEHREEQ